MAISTNASILAMLKVWYKDGVENLMFRNSPVLRKLTKTRVEGKQQNFAAMYGRGGAVGADFLKALANAASVSKSVEFGVVPGQVFSVYTMNAKEVQASVSKRGAYMKVAGAKMFAAAEGFRKTMAASLYGRGYGEIGSIPANTEITTGGTAVTLKPSAIMKIDVGSQLDVVNTLGQAAVGTVTVTAINGDSVTLAASSGTVSAGSSGATLCLAGSVDASNSPLLPVGLDGWLPVYKKRTGSEWESYIQNPFFGVARNAAADRLAGAFIDDSGVNSGKVSDTLQKLIMKCRRQGSVADIIVMNDADFLTLSNEIQSTNTYFTQTSTKGKREANIGFDRFSASFSTNFIENIIDDPFCPEGRVYVLDSSAVEFWSYTNVDKINDGIDGNNPGKQDPMAMDGEGQENRPYGLIIDDYLNVQSGTGTVDGPATNVTLQCFGSFVVTNPSVCGVAELPGSTDFAAA